MSIVRVALLSDLHFEKWTWGTIWPPSIRWKAGLNSLLNPTRRFSGGWLPHFLDQWGKDPLDAICILGDLTVTGSLPELNGIQKVIDQISALNVPLLILPGNHDHYVEGESHFRRIKATCVVHFDEISTYPLGKSWYWIGVDTSGGTFDVNLEGKLRHCLERLSRKFELIVASHFPLSQHVRNHHDRLSNNGSERFLKLLKEYKVSYHWHGHRHLAKISTVGQMCLIDAGSCALEGRGTWVSIDLQVREAQLWERKKDEPFKRGTAFRNLELKNLDSAF